MTPEDPSIDLEVFIHDLENFTTKIKKNHEGKHYLVIKIGKSIAIHPKGFDKECVDQVTLMGRQLLLAAVRLENELAIDSAEPSPDSDERQTDETNLSDVQEGETE